MLKVVIATIVILGAATPAGAATMFVYADPMTFETRRVVVDPTGPDRTYLCLLPPSQVGCQEIRRKRR